MLMVGRLAGTGLLVAPVSRVGGFSFLIFLTLTASTMRFSGYFSLHQTFYSNPFGRGVAYDSKTTIP